jgi:hypothetical protein
LTRSDATKPSVALDFPLDYPPTPEIFNLAAAQTIDPAADFLLQWNGIPGATDRDMLQLTIIAGEFRFVAPDLCLPRLLPNTATSIVIPKNTLPTNTTFHSTLSFSRTLGSNTNSIPDLIAFSYNEKSVQFTLKTTGGGTTPTRPRFVGCRMLANGHFQLELEGKVGQNCAIEVSGNLTPGSWSTLQTVVITASGRATVDDPRTGSPVRKYYRASVL